MKVAGTKAPGSGLCPKRTIAENIPYEYVSTKIMAVIVDGQDDSTSESVQKWIGSYENYRFSEKDGVTTVDIEMTGDSMDAEAQEIFEDMWPKGLAKLKTIVEQ
jgi:hypothetical protein